MKSFDPSFREPLVRLLTRTSEFTTEEVGVALELFDATASGADAGAYRFVFDVDETSAELRGYLCFGPTPMTQGTFDLYWIAVAPERKGSGVGRALVEAMHTLLAKEAARLVRVETSGLGAYASTRAFYDAIGYRELARIDGFYAPGNDLVIYGRYFTAES